MERRNEQQNIVPFKATHPGYVLKMELKERGISQRDFAKSIGIQPPHLNELLQGKRNLSVEFARKLEASLGIPARSWMDLQVGYELDSAAIKARDDKESVSATIENMLSEEVNIKEFNKRLGITSSFASVRLESLKSRLGFNEPLVECVRYPVSVVACFKKSDRLSVDKRNLNTWILLARAACLSKDVPTAYEKGNGINAAVEIAKLANAQTVTEADIERILLASGIGYSVVEKLEHVPVDGFSCLVDSVPHIVVSHRHDNMDMLVFNILHEIGHIEKHLTETDSAFVSMYDYGSSNPIEREANKFAEDTLIPPSVWKSIMSSKSPNVYSTAKVVAQEARSKGISPSIALWRYRHETGVYGISGCTSRKIS